ncbi:hypothetical protein FVR03_21730 [Pontibacter qinzhouensis]|uniref:AP2/ERF domain-containing protein n=1 Tax=Pontibacter qinzhouensis TaxID=2603253 RepID=A0A5C8IZK8_9BACT|nr:NUMOD4 domain-containing protein [Pontibacter qinzhouensis]TXK26546.1 hypothetical protein FVR03_21730 [Pontibacter qinzhouensis]
METEIFKDIPGFEGIYQVSNFGRVKSLKFNKVKMLILTLDAAGYPRTGLSVNGKYKSYKVHRIVAQVFIPNPDNKPFLDHINGNRADNRIENLRWVSHRENGRNQTVHRSNKGTSKFYGVSWHTRDEIWISQIKIGYQNLYLGCFKQEEDAAKAYDKALEELGLEPVNFK